MAAAGSGMRTAGAVVRAGTLARRDIAEAGPRRGRPLAATRSPGTAARTRAGRAVTASRVRTLARRAGDERLLVTAWLAGPVAGGTPAAVTLRCAAPGSPAAAMAAGVHGAQAARGGRSRLLPCGARMACGPCLARRPCLAERGGAFGALGGR